MHVCRKYRARKQQVFQRKTLTWGSRVVRNPKTPGINSGVVSLSPFLRQKIRQQEAVAGIWPQNGDSGGDPGEQKCSVDLDLVC